MNTFADIGYNKNSSTPLAKDLGLEVHLVYIAGHFAQNKFYEIPRHNAMYP